MNRIDRLPAAWGSLILGLGLLGGAGCNEPHGDVELQDVVLHQDMSSGPYNQAIAALRQRRYDDAIRLLEQVVAEKPKDDLGRAEAARLLSRAYRDRAGRRGNQPATAATYSQDMENAKTQARVAYETASSSPDARKMEYLPEIARTWSKMLRADGRFSEAASVLEPVAGQLDETQCDKVRVLNELAGVHLARAGAEGGAASGAGASSAPSLAAARGKAGDALRIANACHCCPASVVAEIRVNLGLAAEYSGNDAEAADHYRQGIEAFGQGDVDRAIQAGLYKNYILALGRLGRYDEARQAAATAEKIAAKSGDASLLWALGVAYYQMGDYADSLAQLKLASYTTKQNLRTPDDRYLYAEILLQTAITTQAESGDWRPVRKMLDETLSTVADLNSPRDMILKATVHRNLGLTYLAVGQIKESKEQAEQALELRKRYLGPNHPETLQMEVDLAALSYQLSRYIEAERMIRSVLDRLPADQAQTRSLRCSAELLLSWILSDDQRPAEALQHASAASRLADEEYGRSAPVSVGAYLCVALNSVLAQRGSAQTEVKPMLREAESRLEELKRGRGKNHPDVLKNLVLLADVYQAYHGGKEYAEQALDRYEEAEQAYVSRFGADHIDVARVRLKIARLRYQVLGQPSEAEQAYRKALLDLNPSLRRHAVCGEIYEGLYDLFMGKNQIEQAQGNLVKALDIYKTALGEDSAAYQRLVARRQAAVGEDTAD